jgi:LacI family transcriptional regulator
MESNKETSKHHRVTMTDVAKAAGVSQTTVSFVVNNLDAGLPERTKRKVLQACADLNYSPNEAARRLASKVSRAIGLAVYDITAISNYRQAAATVIASVYRACETRQQRLQIYTTHERREDGADIGTYFAVPVRSREVDGIVVWDSFIDEKRIVSAYNEGLALVTLDRRCDNVPSVVPDYDYGFRRIAELVAEKGYESICLVTRGKRNFYRDRRARGAFISAATELGLPMDSMTSLEIEIETQTNPEAMTQLIDKLLAKKPWPRVMVCMYDVIALAAIAALHNRGVRVPEEVAVVGCAGVPASADPAYGLTTLDLKHDLMGQHAVDLVLRMVKGEDMTGTSVAVQPELIVRSTT